ncbi:MAG: hypothetical protein QOH13_1366 [Thermoleophilaceae bacterium]|nr:hypothetical protein [Thermoleophilaceae bacterium]
MKHVRHYTVEQANAALPWVIERIERLRTARDGFADEDAREALGEATPGNGGGEPGRVVSEAFLELQSAANELDAVEVIVRDLERGLVDFPGLIDGREVYLCWEEGEDEVTHWHETDDGFSGRQAL